MSIGRLVCSLGLLLAAARTSSYIVLLYGTVQVIVMHASPWNSSSLDAKWLLVALGCLRLCPLIVHAREDKEVPLVLSESITNLALASAHLSALAYEHNPPPGDGFHDFGFYDAEPDQALVAERDGYCYAAFRGTTLTWIDWQQNIELGTKEVCSSTDGQQHCCHAVRSGFYKAYHTSYVQELEQAVRQCVTTHCADHPQECVVLTGHSQGGAIAAVAGLALEDLHPYVITFGQPATIYASPEDEPDESSSSSCHRSSMVESHKWYRFINTKASETIGIVYDPVPFVPGMGATFVGHMIVLGDERAESVAYLGLDANEGLGPLNINGFECHAMIGAKDEGVPYYPGYLDRLQALVANRTDYPIPATGFTDHSLCSENAECRSKECGKDATSLFSFARCLGHQCIADQDCPTGYRCDHGSCLIKSGSCMVCDEDSDCVGDQSKCMLYRCSAESGLMDDKCICKWDEDCKSGRCELMECQAKLLDGAGCNENSDCQSEQCTWRFKCKHLKETGAFCMSNSDCVSDSCSWLFRCKTESYADASSPPTAVSAVMVGTGGKSSSKISLQLQLAMGVVCLGMLGAVKGGSRSRYRRRAGYQEMIDQTA